MRKWVEGMNGRETANFSPNLGQFCALVDVLDDISSMTCKFGKEFRAIASPSICHSKAVIHRHQIIVFH
jgi:hypothetical protein